MTTIITFDNFTGLEMIKENFEVFNAANMREAALSALESHGLTENNIPSVIYVYSGDATITENDGDRFWCYILADYLGDKFEWAYGDAEENAFESIQWGSE